MSPELDAPLLVRHPSHIKATSTAFSWSQATFPCLELILFPRTLQHLPRGSWTSFCFSLGVPSCAVSSTQGPVPGLFLHPYQPHAQRLLCRTVSGQARPLCDEEHRPVSWTA